MGTLFWVGGAGFILYYSELPTVLRGDPRINRFFLRLTMLSLTGVFFGVLYMVVWVPLTVEFPVHDFNFYCPRLVQFTCASGLATYITFVITIWPVWGLVSIPMVSVFSIASLFAPTL